MVGDALHFDCYCRIHFMLKLPELYWDPWICILCCWSYDRRVVGDLVRHVYGPLTLYQILNDTWPTLYEHLSLEAIYFFLKTATHQNIVVYTVAACNIINYDMFITNNFS